uniref:PH domain-containing protein n=1 Tax=Anaerolinea thermolimosa TaxID=229919 RepID=A0A7C4PJ61_9CHLR
MVTFLITLIFFLLGLSWVATSYPSSAPSDVSALGGVLLCVSGPLLFYSILLGLQSLILIFTTEFAITNRRVIAKSGFIRRHTLEMLLAKIESVSVNQNILGRLLNFGTVTVTGTGGTKESFRAIVDPVGVRKKINQIIEDYLQP